MRNISKESYQICQIIWLRSWEPILYRAVCSAPHDLELGDYHRFGMMIIGVSSISGTGRAFTATRLATLKLPAIGRNIFAVIPQVFEITINILVSNLRTTFLAFSVFGKNARVGLSPLF